MQQVRPIMHSRSIVAPLLATLATFVLAATAAAGGWAQASLDAPVTPPTAGQPFDVSFTLYQHGVTPVNSGNAVVVATAPDGRELSFTARRTGGQAHWTATLTLPTAGEWRWAIALPNQLEVEPESFGTLQVAAAASTTVLQPAQMALLALAVLAVLLVAMWRRPGLRAMRLPAHQAQRP